MNKFAFSLLFTLFSSNVWSDDITQSLQQSKQQFAALQSQNQQRWLEQHQFQSTSQAVENGDFSQICLDYQGVKFKGITLIDPMPFAPKSGECLNEARLNQLSQQLTQAYVRKGYIHNPFQFEDDQSGVLTLHVFEGKIAAIESDNKRFNLSQILPNAIGKPLKVQDLDQALDQANRITGNSVSVDVLPAKNGEVKLKFTNEPISRFNGSIGLDNYASRTYDRWQARSSVSIGNPFGLSDTLYLSGSHTLKSRHQFSRSALLYYSLPYGYWTFSGFASISQFKTPLSLQTLSLQQKGQTLQTGLTADYVFHRGSNHISTFSTQLEKINSKNRLDDVILDLQSPKLSSISIGFNHLQLFENATFVIDFRYEQGRNKGENQPEDRFSRWNFELKFNRYQPIGEQLFRHSHQLTSQYSYDYLPSIKQEDLTGRNRVRGLNDLSLSAEKNIVLHNDIAWVRATEFGTFSPYVGIDFGVQKSIQTNVQREQAFAYAVGLNWEQKTFQANLEWATGRLFSKTDGVKQDRWLLGNISYQF